MKLMLSLATSAILAVPVMAQDDPVQKGGGTLPPGWSARLDRPNASMADVKFGPMGPGLHVTTGPHVILWREADRVAGNYHVVATFTRTKAPEHPESYGLFIGGKDLKGDGQTYTYLMVRGDGKVLVKLRKGTETPNVTPGWVENGAAAKADEAGKATDKLEIQVSGGKVTFSVNGQPVHTMDAPAGSLDGIAGLRIGHHLDIHIAGFGVHKM